MTTETSASLERWIRRLMYFVLAAPLIPPPAVLFPTIFGRALVIMTLVAVAALLAIWLRANKPPPAAPQSRVTALLAAYLAVLGVATIFSVDRGLSLWGDQARMDGLVFWIFAFIFFLLVRGFLSRARERDRALTMTCVVATIQAIFAIGQWFLPALRELVGAAGERVSGTFGNPILLAAYLAPHAVLTIGRIKAMPGARRWLWVVAAALQTVAIVFTQSRGGAIALMAGLIVLATLLVLFIIKGRDRMAVAGAGLILAAFAIALVLGAPGTERLPTAFRTLNLEKVGGTLATRLINWQIGFDGWKQRPLLGWGPENFRVAFERNYRPEILRYSFAETTSDKPHNLFIEIASEAGALGLLAYLGLIATAVVTALRRRDVFVPTAIMAYLAAMFFAFESPSMVVLFVLLLALSTPPRPDGEPQRDAARFPTLVASAGLAVPLLLLAMIYRSLPASVETRQAVDAAAGRSPSVWLHSLRAAVARPSVFRDENLHHLARWTVLADGRESLPDLTIKESVTTLLPHLEKATAAGAPNFVLTFMKGQLYMIRGRHENDKEALARAEAVLREAAALAPRHQAVPVILGRLKLIQGDPPGAVKILRAAVAVDPTIPDPHWFLGLALTASGDHTAGLEEIDAAIRLGRDLQSARERVYVIDLLAEAKRFEDVAWQYQVLISQQPDEPRWHVQLAATYAELGRPELAISEALRAIELDPRVRDHARAFLKSYGIELP